VNDNVLTRLLLYFGPLSLMTVGGGQAVVADIHHHVVESYGWFSEAEFLNLYAISRITPGPGTLLVTLIGWKVGGLVGAVAASVAIFLPSSLLVYGLARLWGRFRGAPWQLAIERGLAPIAAGMVLTTAFILLRAAEGGWLAWLVAGASAVALTFTRTNAMLPILLGAATFGVFSLAGLPG
jgi:chromate transporter